MNFELAHKLVAYAFACLGLGLLVSTPLLLPFAKFIVAAAILGTWFLEHPLIDRKGYTQLVAAAAFALLLLQGARIAGGARLLEVGVEYAICLQLLKLAQRRGASDYRQITILGFLHLVAASVLAFDLEYAAVFVGFILVTPWMLTLTHLRFVIEQQDEAEATPQERQAALRSAPLPFRSFFIGTAALALPLFLVTATLFLVFPRIGWGFLSRFSAQRQSIAGFGDDINLGGFGAIRDDPTVVLRVRVLGASDPQPKLLPIRLRGTSFDLYQNSRWTRRPSPRRSVLHRGDNYSIIQKTSSIEDWSFEITIENIEEPVLFLPEGTIGLIIPPKNINGYPRYREISYGQGFDFRYPRSSDETFSYIATAEPGLNQFPEIFSKADEQVYLSVPQRSVERISELAHEVTQGITNLDGQASKIEHYLQSEGGYTYSLIQPDVGTEDPLEVFMFKARSGHCEYFSTAMIMMLRTLGIPARNVTGFLGAELNSYAGYYVVRNANAHSWVEAFLNGKWVTFDPTPADRRVVMEPDTWIKKMMDIIDAMRAAWADYVIDYDFKMQQQALSSVMSWLRSQQSVIKNVWGRDKVFSDENKDDERKEVFSAARSVALWVVGALFLGLLCAGLVVLLRRARRSVSEEGKATRVYKALEHELRAKGLARSPDATPLEFSREVRELDFSGSQIVDEVTDEYLQSRFGGKALSAAEYQRLMKRVRAISDHSIVKRVPNTEAQEHPNQKSAVGQ